MATPSANHHMRQYTTAQLRAIVADPRHYGVGERLDADAILRERPTAGQVMDARTTTTEAMAERMIDRMVMRRLVTDRAYIHAADAEEQALREAEITGECVRAFDAKYRVL